MVTSSATIRYDPSGSPSHITSNAYVPFASMGSIGSGNSTSTVTRRSLQLSVISVLNSCCWFPILTNCSNSLVPSTTSVKLKYAHGDPTWSPPARSRRFVPSGCSTSLYAGVLLKKKCVNVPAMTLLPETAYLCRRDQPTNA